MVQVDMEERPILKPFARQSGGRRWGGGGGGRLVLSDPETQLKTLTLKPEPQIPFWGWSSCCCSDAT